MIDADFSPQFMAGLERSLRHWLLTWRAPGDQRSLASLRGHALRALDRAAAMSAYLLLAADLAIAMHPHMIYTGAWDEWKTCLARLVAASTSGFDEERQFSLLHYLAAICFRQGQYHDAVAWGERVCALAEGSGDRAQQTIAVNLLAEIYLAAEDFVPAQRYADQAAALAAASGDGGRHADALINQARAHLGAAVQAAGGLAQVEAAPLTASQTAHAERCLRRALALAEAGGVLVFEVKAHLFLHHALAARGEWEQALQRSRLALSLIEIYGDDAGRGVVLNAVGRSLAGLGRRAEAIEVLQQAERIHAEHNNRPAQQSTRQRLELLLSKV